MNIDNKSKKWIALYTKPKHEKSVANQLDLKGFEVYLPLLKERRKWSDRKKWIEYPLFKSYLFAKIINREAINISQTPGVVKIVKFSNRIAIVNENSIQAIKLMLDGGYNPKPTDYFITGDLVTVKDGPLKGLEGEVVNMGGNDRLIIRIESIQHSISVKINRAFLLKRK
tara:strand:+ start:380 stop:889 length:510 start_codon:yes stop_codon:yes gene_type:complete